MWSGRGDACELRMGGDWHGQDRFGLLLSEHILSELNEH